MPNSSHCTPSNKIQVKYNFYCIPLHKLFTGILAATENHGVTNSNWRCGNISDVDWPVTFSDIYSRLPPAEIKGFYSQCTCHQR